MAAMFFEFLLCTKTGARVSDSQLPGKISPDSLMFFRSWPFNGYIFVRTFRLFMTNDLPLLRIYLNIFPRLRILNLN